jgi:mRNA-degrading endonuclease RelE of RelBE toxin-antitoxin system
MIRFFTTDLVRNSIEKYLKKDEYKSCKDDLCSFFCNKSIDDIFSQPILVAPNKEFNFIKSRIENSSFCKGKSGGYRLYYYVDRIKALVYLVGFYPKTGKYGRDDLTDTELKIHIRRFSEEKEKGILCEHDIRNQFQPKNVIVN